MNCPGVYFRRQSKVEFQSIWKQIAAKKVLLADISKPFIGIHNILRRQLTHKVYIGCIKYATSILTTYQKE